MISWWRVGCKGMLRSWEENPALHSTTLFILTASFSVVSFFSIGAFSIRTLLLQWGDVSQITLYLKDSADERAIQEMRERWLVRSEVERIEYNDRSRSMEQFRGALANMAPELINDDELLKSLPASLDLVLKPLPQNETTLARIESLAGELRREPIIQEVSYGQLWIQDFRGMITAGTSVLVLLGSILLAASAFVVANVTRSSVISRAEEIALLELMGATSSMIRAPFLVEGMVFGFASSGMGLLVVAGVNSSIRELLSRSTVFSRAAPSLVVASVPLSLALLTLGTILGLVAAWMTSRSVNTGWADRDLRDRR